MGEGGIKNGQKNSNVFYGLPLSLVAIIKMICQFYDFLVHVLLRAEIMKACCLFFQIAAIEHSYCYPRITSSTLALLLIWHSYY